MSNETRCPWGNATPLYRAYHDEEWGVPLHQDRRLFEMLVLEGAQAGLSWRTILEKRAHYRKVFDGFDPKKVARYDKKKIAALLADAGIVRNRLKVESAVTNARAFLAVQKEHGSFDAYLWAWSGGKPIVNRPTSLREVPSRTPLSDALSKDLKQRGFRFVGSTIVYAFLEAVGVVDDHVATCFKARPSRSARSARPGRRARPARSPRPARAAGGRGSSRRGPRA
jgi:DNA-3-methyladenine glycosylase I